MTRFIAKRSKASGARRARPWLNRVRAELPALEVVVCFGDLAANAWDAAQPQNRCRSGWAERAFAGAAPVVVACPHTTNRNIVGANKTRSIKDGLNPEDRIRRTLLAAAQRLGHSGS
jgi:hypothetical protein